jgi:uncharacterized protein (TIGR03545 family)
MTTNDNDNNNPPQNSSKTENSADSKSNSNLANDNHTTKKKAVKTGLIRWGGIIPFITIVGLLYLYFLLFFDSHMRALIEWSGYKALGSEVNVDHFSSSFIKGNFKISRIQVTNAENPKVNSIEINEIRFAINMDALLRLKFVIEDMGVDGIQFASLRKTPGKVAPPSPPEKDEGPSIVDQMQSKALDKIDGQYQNNILGDVAGFLKSGNGDQQLKNIEDSLKSKKLAEELKTKWQSKQTDWENKIKKLPTDVDFKNYKSRFDAIKYKDFNSPQELDASVKQFNQLKTDVDEKIKLVDTTKTELTTDIKSIQVDAALIDQQIKSDIASIKDRLKIPKLDATSLTKSLFMDFLSPYLAKVDRYKKLAKKYLPPKYANMLDKDSREKQKMALAEENLIPHKRESGTTYEYPKIKGYPLFWIKNISISSKSNQNSDYGDLTGKITDVTSNQRQINKTTQMKVSGDFKSKKLLGVNISAILNNLKAEPEVSFVFGYGSLPMEGISLLKTDDGTITIPNTSTSSKISGSTVGFRTIDLNFNFNFAEVNFASAANDKIVAEILTKTLAQINQFDLKGGIKGEIKTPEISINSSLGRQLETAFQNLLKEKIDEANKRIREEIEKQVSKYKAEFEKVKSELTNQANAEIKKVQDQLDSQKKQAETRVEQAKKDLENQGKKKIEQEGKKAIDDLKKKLGF